MKENETQYLEFNSPERFHRLNRLFSPYLASRYHVLPLAEDGALVTVAMANPDDKEAREAILDILGPSVYIVRADRNIIDSLLAKFCNNANNCSLNLALWMPNNSISSDVKTYANHLADLLGAHLMHFGPTSLANKATEEFNPEVNPTNTGIGGLEELEQSIIKGPIDKSPTNKIADRRITSLLVVRQPRWPIKNFLLILRNDANDETAVDWTIRVARSSGANVTVLPLSIPVPTIYHQKNSLNCSLDKILTSDTEFGIKLRLVAQLLVNSQVTGTLRLRQEPPTWQIRFELLENDYDLVVIDRKPSNKFSYWILGELVNPLLSWTDRPLLLTSLF